jgi:hypothetical protein
MTEWRVKRAMVNRKIPSFTHTSRTKQRFNMVRNGKMGGEKSQAGIRDLVYSPKIDSLPCSVSVRPSMS